LRIKSFIVVPTAVLSLVTFTACSSTSDTQPSTETASTTASATTVTSTTAAATTAAAETTAATATADYSPIPKTPALSPQADSLDFGILTSITTSNGVVTLHLNRAHFYMGDAAKAHNKGKAPLDDFIFDDTDGKKEYTFTLDPKASLQAEAQLTKGGEGGNDTRETLTQEDFVSRMKKLSSTKDAPKVMVWLRHTDGLTSPVTALVDQFIT
jgi:hypothetical protein